MPETPKQKIKPTKIVVVRDEDGDLKAYATGDRGVVGLVEIYVAEEDSFGDTVATKVEVEAWADCPRKVKSAVKDATT